MNTINKMMDDLLNTSISSLVGTDFTQSYPAVNITENNHDYLIELAAPGIEKEDFKIKIEKDQLIISTSSAQNSEDPIGKYKRREFNYSTFKRSFHLPDTINSEAISAKHEDGVLKVSVPKIDEADLKNQREIKIS